MSVLGTIGGAALAIILQGGLVVIGVASFYQEVVVGVVLIVAVSIDGLRNRSRERR